MAEGIGVTELWLEPSYSRTWVHQDARYIEVYQVNYGSTWQHFKTGTIVHLAGASYRIKGVYSYSRSHYRLEVTPVASTPATSMAIAFNPATEDPVIDLMDHMEAAEDNSDVPEEFRKVPLVPSGLAWPIEVYAKDAEVSEHILVKIIRRDPASSARKGIVLKIPWNYLHMVAPGQDLCITALPDKDKL